MRSGRHTVHTESLFGDGCVWFLSLFVFFMGGVLARKEEGCFCIENKDESRSVDLCE